MIPHPSTEPLLAGVKVLDLSRVLAGPYCTMLLGDLGAEVIKVEEPKKGDDTRYWGPPFAPGGESGYFLCTNRNKRSLTLNLKSDAGQAILRKLITRSDVLVENFKVDTLAGWGLDYAELQRLRPDLVYCTITGYGYTGPYRERPGYDFIVQALGGLMSVTGAEDGEPTKVGVAIADITAGLFACNAILAALFARQRSGAGQRIDISLLDSQVAGLANVASNYLVSRQPAARYGNAHPNIVPYQTFQAQDGYFALAVGNDAQYNRLCSLLGHPEWASDRRFSTNAARVEHRQSLVGMLQEIFQQYPVTHWLAKIDAVGVPCAPINTIEQVFADPQVLARSMLMQLPHPTAGSVALVNSPLNIPTSGKVQHRPPPLLGEHSVEILLELGEHTQAEIAGLKAAGVI